MSSHYATIARAIERLTQMHPRPLSLDALSLELGLSASHLQRLFTQYVGISPKRFSQYLLLQDARERLSKGEAVLNASVGVGLSSAGRLHDLLVHCDAITPGERRSGGVGLEVAYDGGQTPFGWGLFGRSARGLCYFSLHGEPVESSEQLLKERFPFAQLAEHRGLADELIEQIFSRKAGGELSLHLRGTNFQIQVWQALLAIPEGMATSYGSIARCIGRPKACRAVGTAVGYNPIAILIPCHRVLRDKGAIGGYRWGLHRKKALLASETLSD